MNKYQEALNWLRVSTSSKEHNERFELLQELVDKETPIKPNHFKNGYRKCDNCGMKLLSTNGTPFKYCSECGQKIDWNDERVEEKSDNNNNY